MKYEWKSEQFSGPIEKLLELIEERKLDISEVSISAVTEDFLKYLEAIKAAAADESLPDGERERLRLIVDFLTVASRLILIKSKSLLPDTSLSQEEEEGIADLELRLRLFKTLRPAMKLLRKQWGAKQSSFARPYFLTLPPTVFTGFGGSAFFFPANNVLPGNLRNALTGIFGAFRSIFEEENLVRERLVTLEEEMTRIVERISSGAATLRQLSASSGRAEVIVLFLALLHLAREQVIKLAQDGNFSDILVDKQETLSA
jgi:segregation and condensation protein A